MNEDPWGSLTDEEKEIIKSRTQKLTQEEIKERFIKRRGKALFVSRKPGTDEAPELGWEAEREYEVEIPLISAEEFARPVEITPADEEAAKGIDEDLSDLEAYFERDRIEPGEGDNDAHGVEASGLPPAIDHSAKQSPVKDQRPRQTCVAHATLALLETFPGTPRDLSEQYAHYKFNEFLKREHSKDRGLVTTKAAQFLARADGRICEEKDWPYIRDQATINRMIRAGTYSPPAAARNNQTFGIRDYKIIDDKGGLTGTSIKNTRYLEALLYKGYDIVVGAWVSWTDANRDGILDLKLDEHGNPIRKGGHAMLVVGYNRPRQYFILKNSSGRAVGHSGYYWFGYDLARVCFKYGFTIQTTVPV